MRIIVEYIIIISLSFLLVALLCTAPDNPFQNTDSVNLLIDVPRKENKLKYCVNDLVTFNVTVQLPHLVKYVSIEYGEDGDRDEQEITTDEPNSIQLQFSYKYQEKGPKRVKFTITFRGSGNTREIDYNDIDIGLKPTILNEKNFIVAGEVKLHKPITISVEHEKYGATTYIWYKDNEEIAGNNYPSLIINPIKKSDIGEYYCCVSTDWGEDTTNVYNLSIDSVIKPPEIQNHPQSVQATAGNSAIFTIIAKGEQIKYQWQKNEQDISGANDTSYEVTDLKIGDSATYRCIVSNIAGSDTSGNAYLEVFEKEMAPKITKQPESREVDAGDAAMFKIEAEGTNLKYKWFRDDQEIGNAVQAILKTGPVSKEHDGKVFHCVVSNTEGEELSNKATLTVKSIAKPDITGHPQDISVTVGTPVMFSVDADGKNLTFQWFENGKEIDQATEQSYVIQEAKLEDNGKKFNCTVSNPGGKVISNEATLTVTIKITAPEIDEQPKNQEVTAGNNARFLVIAKGIKLTYQWQENLEDIVGATQAEYIHRDAKKEDNGKKFRCIVSNSAGKAVSEEAELKVIENVIAPKITEQPLSLTVKENEDARFSITAEGTNVIYQWSRNGKEISGADQSTLKITSVSRDDNKAKYTCVLRNSAGEAKSDVALLTVHYAPAISTHPGDIGVKQGEKARFKVEVENGNPEKTYFQWYNGGSKLSGETNNEIVFTAGKEDNGKKYSCQISNSAGFETESKTAKLSVYYIEITKQPQDQSVSVGGKATFTIKARGNPDDLYHRWKIDSSRVGENSSTYTISKASLDDDGKKISCEISNGKADPVTSNFVRLSVKDQAPKIISNPGDKEALEGEIVQFSVEAGGTNLEYQWYYDDRIMAGDTESSLSITAHRNNNNKEYHCIVRNGEGTKTSEKATLKVFWLDDVSITPSEKTVEVNEEVTFEVNAGSSNPPPDSYVWKKNSSPFGNGRSIVNYTPTKVGDGGTISCVVSNGKNPPKTAVAKLTVKEVYYKLLSVNIHPPSKDADSVMWDTLTITAIPVWLDNKKPPDNVTYKFYFYSAPAVHENCSGESDKHAFYCDFDALPRVYVEVIYNNITVKSADLTWE